MCSSDLSRRGLQAAIRINQLAQKLNIGVGKSYLIINQTREAPAEKVLDMIREEGLELAGTVPADDMVYEYDLDGKPTVAIPDDNAAVRAAFEIFDKIIE